MTAGRGKASSPLNAAVQRTPACIDLDRLEGDLTDSEREHVQTCPRCQTELSLLNQFRTSTPAPDEGAAVQWIVSEVRRRRAGQQGDRRSSGGAIRGLFGWHWRPLGLTTAALIAIVVVGYVARDREPQLGNEPSIAYRTEQLQVISPVGDLTAPPSELTWVAVPGAARYDVGVLQVDRTRLWRASSSAPRVALPESVIAQLAPGKSVIWEVTAVNASGTVIAVSGTQRFRVTP